MLGFSWIVTIKDALGLQPIRLDKDELKEKVKQVCFPYYDSEGLSAQSAIPVMATSKVRQVHGSDSGARNRFRRS